MILITGASGFIGRRLAVRLADLHSPAQVRCVVKAGDDAFGEDGIQFLRNRSLRPIPCDLRTGDGLGSLPSAEIIFHLAANTHTWERDQTCNDLGTENLLHALGPLGPRHHLLFTSSVAVMDNRPSLCEPLRLDTPLLGLPLSTYGRTKLRAERCLIDQATKQGLRLTILRLCTVYGPKPRPNSFFDILKKEVVGGSVASRLNWPGLTSFIHVDDVVDRLLLAAEHPPPPGEPHLDILATESFTLAQISSLLYQAQGLPYRRLPLPAFLWRTLACSHRLCRPARCCLPANLFNLLWRFNLVVNPVFHCDTSAWQGPHQSLETFAGF